MIKENIKNWLKVNLFSNWYNSIISLFVFFFILSIIPSFIDWAIIKATFIGKTKADCKAGGACWVFISVWFEKFIYGFFYSQSSVLKEEAGSILLSYNEPSNQLFQP